MRALTSIVPLLAAAALPATAQGPALSTELLRDLRFRSIGPAVTGGRIHDVEALPDDPARVYVATASGGLWKSVNQGTTWVPIFDHQPVSTFGDIAIAASDPDIIWAGTGEQNNRQSSSWGDGVYRSTDGGRTWTHVGLAETRHIGRVRVDPRNPAVAYVAALGNLWAANPQRGVFKTTDEGQHWEKVLGIDDYTGAVDLAMDPTHPDVLYAATYQRLRRAWGFNGGGPGSGIYRTTDGGEHWEKLSGGLPAGSLGRIGLAISTTNPPILYATVEHASQGGVYRSADGGDTWVRVNRLNPRPAYYSHIFVDPTDADRVYLLGVDFYRSDDGGRHFRALPTHPTYDVGVHTDFHSLWIDPGRPGHLYLGGDGGLYESWDMGETYLRLNNLPIGQFYAIGLDDRDPYSIYGGLQDNHSWMGPSATRHWAGILGEDWHQIGFNDGMYQQPDPTGRFVYSNSTGGHYARVDVRTGDILDITPRPPAGEPRYRWDWASPSLVSRHDPQVVYVGGNRLFISHDRGVSWTRTMDLTRQQSRDAFSLMGVKGSAPMLSKNDGVASFGEITTIAESPIDPRILWVGTDDGNVQVSRNGGRTWTEVARRARGVRTGTYVSRVLASASGPGVAYVAFDAHRDGDFRPYVFRTTNFGRTWTAIDNGLPPDGSIHVIVEDPENPDVLYLGTEHGLFVSVSSGRQWVPFMANLPTTIYADIAIQHRDHDLVLATHGRSIWILDDARPLALWTPAVAASPAHLFPIRPTRTFQYWKDTSYRGQGAYAGENPPEGAMLTYWVGTAVTGAVRITIADAARHTIRTLPASGEVGFHRTNWDLRHEPPPSRGRPGASTRTRPPNLPHELSDRGPFVAPGRYVVTLEAGSARSQQVVEVKGDPLLSIPLADQQQRESFLLDVLRLQREAADTRQRASDIQRALSSRLDSLADHAPKELLAAVDSARVVGRRVAGAVRSLRSLASDFNGDAVQQGSMYPPTDTHKRWKLELEEVLTAARVELQRLERLTGSPGS